MTKWGSVDFDGLKKLQQRIQDAQKGDYDAFCRACIKELAARLLALVIERTPVGVYPQESGKTGGTLRRGWTAGKEADAKAYAQSLPIEKTGSTYTIEVINPVEYASYVEFGHRQTPGRYVPVIGKRLKASFVEGKYFLTLSEEELERMAPKVLERKIAAYFKEVFDAD